MNNRENLNYSCFNIDTKIAEKLGTRDLMRNGNFEYGDISVYFRNIKQHLCQHIEKAELVLGCVAWLTDFNILTSLAQTDASIIVQKEDFLRPDKNDVGKAKLQAMYSQINSRLKRSDFPATVLYPKTPDGDFDIGGIRCVGNCNREQKAAHPRMHNKFLVFCERNDCMGFNNILPMAVWTGSYNFTNNADYSLENAVFIRDHVIATMYFDEFAQIAALSEPLNWQQDWMSPEWKLSNY